MSLEQLRNEIDQTDSEILSLIARRIRISEKIGTEKKVLGMPIRDFEREKSVMGRVRDFSRVNRINELDIEAIYRQIIAASASVQGTIVAFQGELGAYSEEAAYHYFGNAIMVKPCESFDDVFHSVENQEASFGIVPVENSLEGSISRTYDLLLDSKLKVTGEINLRVMHCLIANPGVKLTDIKKVYSHPQALGQSQGFLKHLGVELIPTYDTAGSVKMIRDKQITDGAAVASIRAAKIYDMNIIAKEIEDNQNNFTRFFILGTHTPPPSGNDKTSIVFSVKHKPGTLFELLKRLALRNINLTKIESRPTRQKPWEYNFYLDFEGHAEDKTNAEALISIREFSLFVKVLGSYPRAQ